MSGVTVEAGVRHQGIETDMMRMVLDRLGRDQQYVVTIHGNWIYFFMEAIAAEEDALKIFEMLADHLYKPMN